MVTKRKHFKDMVKNKITALIKRIPLLKKGINKLRFLIHKFVDEVIPSYFYSSRFTSLLYYIFFSRSFLRELQAVLAGKVKHLQDSKKLKANYFQLTRNIHRLEKGLVMRPRKSIFAKGYIEETVDSYIGIFNEDVDKNNEQLPWFESVLTEYFEIVASDPVIDAQRERFEEAQKHIGLISQEVKKLPYLRDVKKNSNISYEELYKLSKQRRSVRWFQEKPVSRNLIDKALKVALQSPSACNRQPYEFRIFDDPELVDKVINLPGGTRGYAHNVPVVAVVIGNLDAYFSERDRHVIYIDASLASISFMFALETLGLSSCAINWPDVEKTEKKMDELLDLELYQRPVMLLAIGYPDEKEKVPYSEKRPLHLIRQYN